MINSCFTDVIYDREWPRDMAFISVWTS